MQVYKYMDIGTAKLTKDEMEGIRHYLIDVVYPDEDFSVAVFRDMTVKYIDGILSRNKLPMIVGGTGLYVNSLTHNLDFTEIICDQEYRDYLKTLADTRGNSFIHDMLKDIDPDSYNRLHPNDIRRVIRALEVYKYTGKTISEYQKRSREQPIDYELCMVGLTMERQKLYNRINQRVDIMIEKGLVNEVKGLLDMGYNKNLTSMQGLGYKEIAAYLEGEYSLELGIDKLKQNTRHFAKRQLTWFRAEERIHWINVEEFNDKDSIVENIARYLAGKFNFA
jgi:tRNA dimethylallyltransferase